MTSLLLPRLPFSTLLSLLLGGPALAQQAPPAPAPAPVQVTQPAAASLRLRLANPTRTFGQVRVVRVSTGQPLFAETTQEAAYGHRFDFDGVPSGSYTLDVCLGPACTTYTVQVRTRARRSLITACAQTTRWTDFTLSARH